MPSPFLGFFSRRENARTLRKSSEPSLHSSPKSPAGLPRTSTSDKTIPSPSIADASEQLEGSELSLEAEYVLADADSPTLTTSYTYPPTSSSSSNAASPSTSKLKMPFRRKQSTPSKLTAATPQTQNPVAPVLPPKEPHKFSIESSVSSLLPPPSRSAIFGSYADPHNALSTRSLPQDVPVMYSRQASMDMCQDYETMSNPDHHPVSPSKPPSKGGIFSWARPRGRAKSKASIPDPALRSAPVLTLPPTDSSFNLKSFRHVTSPTPETTPPSSASTPPNKSPIPRPPRSREASVASDLSQRISVAAFREAQARRSTADSPVPSLPGDRDSFLSGQIRNRKTSSSLGTPPSGSTAGPQPRRPMSRSPPTRSSTAPLSFSASMTTSDTSEEEESESEEDEEEATLRPRRKRTVTGPSARSELGHRSPPKPSFGASRSDIGHGLSSGLTSRPSPVPRAARNSPSLEASGSGSRTSSVYSHARASVSTSALGSDAAATRASVLSKYSAGSFFYCFTFG